jgi:glycosyltransferase involved in cell wall biosynthesis
MSAAPIRLLAIIEARSITGPAKNLLDFCRVARRIEGRPVETTLVTYQRTGQADTDDFLEAVRTAGVEIEIVRETSAFDRSTVAAIRDIVARRHPDVVQTHAIKSHFLLRLSGLWRATPWVAFHHGYTFDDLKMRAYNLLDRWSLRAPARIVTVSRAFQDQLTRRGVAPARITVLHNAIDPDWLAHSGVAREAARQELGIREGQPLVLAIGRLSHEKAFDCLLEAFAKLPRENPAAEPVLIIVGEGPERSNLERLSGAPGLSGRVRLPGHLRRIAPYYAAADVVAISSITEGSPNVLLEAMAAKVPVVATAVGGIPEIVRDRESALLVAPRDPAALTDALARAIGEPATAEALAAKSYGLILEQHSPQVRARLLASLYAELQRGPDEPAAARPGGTEC